MLDKDETAESPLLTNIEVLQVQVQNKNSKLTADNDVEATVNKSNIDAGDMSGVETYINYNSRADLTIEDVSHNSNNTNLVMRETDMGDVDYNVFFDPENIIAAEAFPVGAKLVVDVLNLLSAAKGENPVAGFSKISFNVGADLVEVDISTATTYDQVLTAIRTQLTTDGITTVTVALEADTAVFNKALGGFAQGDKVSYSQIILTSTDSKLITEGEITLINTKNAGDLYFGFSDAEGSNIESLTTTNVVFDRVGRDSKGGAFLAGSDSTGENSDSQGIQKFEISVDRSSWLSEVSSTNNSLEVINIKNITTNSATQDNQITKKNGKGNLTIDKLVDVRVVDAIDMTGKLNVTATLSEDVVEKYLNLKDTDSSSANDNSEIAYNDVESNDFYYNFGKNNDTLNLTISNANLAAAGTTTREDFVLEINGNGGNDTITTIIGDGKGLSTDNWYINSKANANLAINAGDGDDKVTTTGAGDFKINLGAGNDTAYADNSGAKAKWVVNAGNRDVNDLVGTSTSFAATNAGKANGSFFLVDGKVTVTFADSENTTTGAVGLTNGFEVSANITGTDYVTTMANVNQAIKKAINEDAVLSKLLVAQDGPYNTLVITSLIDGSIVATNLDIVVSSAYSTGANTVRDAEIVKAFQKYMQDSTDVFTSGTENAAVVGAINAVAGFGAAGSVLGQTASSAVAFGAVGAGVTATAAGQTVVIVDGVNYIYKFASGATTDSIAKGVADLLTADGISATVTNGAVGIASTVTINTSKTVTATSADATATATATAVPLANIAGTDSVSQSNNTIEGALGNDVIVLGTTETSVDTLVYTGTFGNDTIVNFMLAEDILDFTGILTDVNSASGSTASEQRIATTKTVDNAASIDLTSNEVAIINDFAQTSATSETWALMTAAHIDAALSATNVAGADNYGNIAVGATTDATTQTTQTSILMIENDLNAGEYKVFKVTETIATNDYSVSLLGQIDFGEAIDATIVVA